MTSVRTSKANLFQKVLPPFSDFYCNFVVSKKQLNPILTNGYIIFLLHSMPCGSDNRFPYSEEGDELHDKSSGWLGAAGVHRHRLFQVHRLTGLNHS